MGSLIHLLFDLLEHYLDCLCEVVGRVGGKQGHDFVLEVSEFAWGDDVQTDDHLVYAVSHFLQLGLVEVAEQGQELPHPLQRYFGSLFLWGYMSNRLHCLQLIASLLWFLCLFGYVSEEERGVSEEIMRVFLPFGDGLVSIENGD